MKRIAQIKGGMVTSEWSGSGGLPVPPDDSWTFIDITDRPEVTVGDLYDGLSFTKPPAPPDYGQTFDAKAFFTLFTLDQRIAMRRHAKDGDHIVEDFLLVYALGSTRLKHPETQRILTYLSDLGIITHDDLLRISDGVALA